MVGCGCEVRGGSGCRMQGECGCEVRGRLADECGDFLLEVDVHLRGAYIAARAAAAGAVSASAR